MRINQDVQHSESSVNDEVSEIDAAIDEVEVKPNRKIQKTINRFSNKKGKLIWVAFTYIHFILGV